MVIHIVLCDNFRYCISDEDYELVKRVSPGYARLAKESRDGRVTHFFCEKCGQFSPLKLKGLHNCQ